MRMPQVFDGLTDREAKRLVEAHEATMAYLHARERWRHALGMAIGAGVTMSQLIVATGLHEPGIRHVLRVPTPEFIGCHPTRWAASGSDRWRVKQSQWEHTRSHRILRGTILGHGWA